ncbi:24442_t:CDS:2, partial [Cetraspora pellucida]
ADQIVKKLPIVLPKHPDHIYTSKIINTQRILNAINAFKEPLLDKSVNFVE